MLFRLLKIYAVFSALSSAQAQQPDFDNPIHHHAFNADDFDGWKRNYVRSESFSPPFAYRFRVSQIFFMQPDISQGSVLPPTVDGGLDIRKLKPTSFSKDAGFGSALLGAGLLGAGVYYGYRMFAFSNAAQVEEEQEWLDYYNDSATANRNVAIMTGAAGLALSGASALFYAYHRGKGPRAWKKLTAAMSQRQWDEAKQHIEEIESLEEPIMQADELDHFTEYIDFMNATEQQYFSSFQRKYPRSVYQPQIFEQKAFKDFASLKSDSSSSLVDYQDFQDKYIGSALIPEARYREEEAAWLKAAQQNTVASYQDFKESYPDGYYYKLAEEKAGTLIYQKVRKADDLDTYISFIQQHPNSHFATEARERSVELAWQRAQSRNDSDSYKQFRETFPDSQYAPLAFSKELDMNWSSTRKMHKIDTYRQFEKEYPKTEQATVAEGLEWHLYEYERKPYPQELLPRITRIFREDDGRYRLYLDVTNSLGEFVGGLNASNFSVYDAGYKANDIQLEGMESNRPVDVVFVLDVSGSMQDKIDGVKGSIIRFSDLMGLRSRDYRLGVVTFVEEIFSINGKDPAKKASMTKDPLVFQRWIENIELESGSEEDDYLALDFAKDIRFRKEAQHIIILISDEIPTNTRRFPGATGIARTLAKKDIIVYAIGPQHNSFQELASITGGLDFPIDRRRFTDIMEHVTQKISKQYRLRYLRPPNAPPVMDELQVKLRVRSDYALIQVNESEPNRAGSDVIKISPNNSSIMYRSLKDNQVLCSQTKGKRWAVCGEGLNANGKIIQFEEDENGTVVGRNELGELWESSDGGKTFSLLESIPKTPVFALSPNGIIWYFADQALKRLEKSGSTTTYATLPEGVKPKSLVLSTHEDRVFILADDKNIYSQKGNYDMEVVPSPCEGTGLSLHQHPSRTGLLFALCEKSLHRSLDSGVSWHQTNLPENTAVKEYTLQSLLIDPTVEQKNLLLSTAGILYSSDIGMNWDWYERMRSGNHSIHDIDMGSDGQIFMADGDKDSVYGFQPVSNREYLFNKLFYKSGAYVPNRKLETHLDDIAIDLRRNRSLQLLIEGHTDSYGSDKENLNLSRKRAKWLYEYMVKKSVPEGQLQMAWYGESRPLASNKTSKGRAQNRRVELLMIQPQNKANQMGKQ